MTHNRETYQTKDEIRQVYILKEKMIMKMGWEMGERR